MEEYLKAMKSLAGNLQLARSSLSLSDLYTQVFVGLDSEYTRIVLQLIEKENLSWIEFQTALLTFESRLEQLHSFQSISLNQVFVNGPTTQQDNKSNNSSFYYGKTRGSWRVSSKINTAAICYYWFDLLESNRDQIMGAAEKIFFYGFRADPDNCINLNKILNDLEIVPYSLSS